MESKVTIKINLIKSNDLFDVLYEFYKLYDERTTGTIKKYDNSISEYRLKDIGLYNDGKSTEEILDDINEQRCLHIMNLDNM